MIYLHAMIAILASWRITELFTQDRVTERLRKRFPTYLWQCPRCMSVWAGAWCSLLLALGQIHHASAWFLYFGHGTVDLGFIPWLNWPFGIAWLYLVRVEQVVLKRLAEKGRELRITVKPDGQLQYNSDLSQQDSIGAISMVMQQLTRASAPAPAANGEAKQA